jgi:hypothetical protein
MNVKTGMSALVLAVMLGTTPAMAQTGTPRPNSDATPPRATEAPKAPVTGQILAQEQNTVLAKELIGQSVYAPDNAKIGNISDLILSKDGKSVQGFVIGVGGFLGIGEKSVALQMDKLKMQSEGDGTLRLVMDTKKEDLANAPSFKSRRDIEGEKRAAERPAPTSPNRPAQKP